MDAICPPEYAGAMFKPTPKYHELITLYARMAKEGYETRRGPRVDKAYSDQEAAKFRLELKPLFAQHQISSVLDYGGGGTDWRDKSVPEGGSLAGFLGVEDYRVFEPAREVDARGDKADAVVCFDVMEHIYVADVGYVLNDLFAQAAKLVVVNVAGYQANALLPNGENAHITIRSAQWWQGALEVIASAHPQVTAVLYHSDTYTNASRLPTICHGEAIARDGYVR